MGLVGPRIFNHLEITDATTALLVLVSRSKKVQLAFTKEINPPQETPEKILSKRNLKTVPRTTVI